MREVAKTRHSQSVIETAWLYYQDDLNQNEIAARLQISRATVVNHLNEARIRGWVRVHLDSSVFRHHHLAETLCDTLGLTGAIVVPDDQDHADLSTSRVVRAAAEWLPDLLLPGDRLGVSWGETVFHMAQHLPRQSVEDLSVVQLLGSRPATLGFAAETCTASIAQNLGGTCINLHVPFLLSSRAMRDQLCAEPVVTDQLKDVANCNKTVLACGVCTDDAHIVQAGILTAGDMHKYRALGAVGVICGRLIDANGQAVPAPAEDRMIGVSLEDMRRKDMSLLVVAGQNRTKAARAAITGGFATHLAIGASNAQELLEICS